jgi:hypothetical protein
MKEKIDYFLNLFPQLTKDEADLIEKVIGWDPDKKAAFIIAKRIFEDQRESTLLDLSG